jgi:hypothetical protein
MIFVVPVIYMDLWGWFVVPLGVPHVAYWHMFGLTILPNVFLTNSLKTVKSSQPTDREDSVATYKWLKKFTWSLALGYFGAWGLGYLIFTYGM